MKSTKLFFAAGAAAGLTLFTACEETVNNITEKAEVGSVSKYKELAKCEKDELGSMVYVSDSSKIYACTVDGWIAMSGADGKDGKDGKDGADGSDGSDGKDGSSCTMKELKSGDGYKVVCGGDSVGVVMNGKDGADGAQGTGCTLKDSFNGAVVVTCGDSVTTLFKAMCGSTPYEPSKSTCVNGVLSSGIGPSGGTSDSMAIVPVGNVTCASTDLFCKSKSFTVNTGLDNGSQTSGFWYTVDDNAEGGLSKVVWPVEPGNDYDPNALDPVIGHCDGVCGTVVLDVGTMVGDYSYAGVAFNIAGVNEVNDAEAANASSWGGICVTYMTDRQMMLKMGMENDVTVSLEYDEPYLTLPKSAIASEKCFSWSSFKQGGWGREKITGDEASAILANLKFLISGNYDDSVKFNIIRLRKFAGDGSSIVPPAEYVDPNKCGDLWCGPSGDYQVATSDGGSWWELTDAEYDGNSHLVWPVSLGNIYSEKALDPVIDYAGGLAGGVMLGDGYEYPYVRLGFYLSDEKLADEDITSWDGICLVYKSNLKFAVELIPEDEEDLTEFNNFKAAMAKTTDIKTVDLSWSSFKQETGWGEKIDLETALKHVNAIAFRFSGTPGTEGGFTFYSIGRYGTCSE